MVLWGPAALASSRSRETGYPDYLQINDGVAFIRRRINMLLGRTVIHAFGASTRTRICGLGLPQSVNGARHLSVSLRQSDEATVSTGDDLATLRLHAIRLYKEVRRSALPHLMN